MDALEVIGEAGIAKKSEVFVLDHDGEELHIVDYINSLYSQSEGGNAGTRAGWKGENILDKETYTKTKLDTQLLSAIKEGKYRLLIITGNAYYDNYKDVNLPDNCKLMPFMSDLICLLKDSDLIVSRAGASTISEITAIGLPSILVPSPFVTNNHQYKNAKELADKGACVIVEEEEFSKDRILREIDAIFDDKELYQNMKKQSKELGVSDSASRIYEEAKRIVR